MVEEMYKEMIGRYKDVVIASSIKGVLYWDIETDKMPVQGLNHRSLQFAYLTKREQDFWKSKKLETFLKEIDTNNLNELEKRNYDLIKRKQKTNVEMPSDLISRLSSKSNTTNQIWKKAKHKQDFTIVKDDMKELFELNKEYAQKLADIKDLNNPFDALIDERDEGLSSGEIGKYFKEARDFLIPFLEHKREDYTTEETTIRNIKLNPEQNFKLAEEISNVYRYPYKGETARGNIDAVEHPLTITCGPDDIRITLNHGTLLNVYNTVNHELGHGIHGLGKNEKWNYLPVNHTGSPTLGECISRYTENKIGKSMEMQQHIFQILKDFGLIEFNNVSFEEFYSSNMKIHPGPKRTSADEVSYGLHIIIRFEIEQALFEDKIDIRDLPSIWNEKYEQYLGIEIENDTEGIMQDLHWYNTYWGYFHGYFMGDLLGSQLHHQMSKELQEKPWQHDLSNGNLDSVLNWFESKIFSKGLFHPPLKLVETITDEKLNVKYFKEYLKAKFD